MSKQETYYQSLRKLIKTKILSKERIHCKSCLISKPAIDFTVDHIVPQNILLSFSNSNWLIYEWKENLEILCRSCNSLKSGKLIITEQSLFNLEYLIKNERKVRSN